MSSLTQILLASSLGGGILYLTNKTYSEKLRLDFYSEKFDNKSFEDKVFLFSQYLVAFSKTGKKAYGMAAAEIFLNTIKSDYQTFFQRQKRLAFAQKISDDFDDIEVDMFDKLEEKMFVTEFCKTFIKNLFNNNEKNNILSPFWLYVQFCEQFNYSKPTNSLSQQVNNKFE